MSTGRMQFDIDLGRSGRGARPREDEDPFRMLALGAFGGNTHAAPRPPLAQRKPIAVDIDNLDQVLARIVPRLDLELEGGPLTIEFRGIDDFHPDQLFDRLAPFAALRKLRAELHDPVLYSRAALALGGPPPAADVPTAAAAGQGDADLERLLGRKPETVAATPATAGTEIDRWLRDMVAPFVVPDIAHERQHFVDAVDAAIAGQMRTILHHPDVQALESAWRGIERLLRELELGETLQLFILDASRAELLADVDAHAGDLAQSALYRHICMYDTNAPDARRWSLIVADETFGTAAEDVRLLAVLGAMAGQAGAPLFAAARTMALGCAGIADLSAPKSWTHRDADGDARWSALRKCAAAPWIGLALPRVLCRLPYGADSDPIESFGFEELPGPRDHEAYLWGNPAYALAHLAAQAFAENGWAMELDGPADITDLPVHIWREDGEARQQPCAEVLVSEAAGEEMLARGIMPFLSYRNRDAARLLRWQSIADPPAALRGMWTSADSTDD